jgi:hypothetical protein
MPAAPILEPRAELMIRWEPDTKKMFIAAAPFKKDCADIQVNYKETLRQLKEQGIMKEKGKVYKRINKGMKLEGPPIYCLEFDTSIQEFFNVSSTLGLEVEDADRGS